MAGVVFAHVLAYFMAAPHRNGREMLLRASGHRHWAVVAAIALGALVAGLIWFTTLATRPDRVWSLGARAFFVSTARRLVLLQVGGFVLLEASERLLFGAGFGQVLAEPVVLIGVVLQVVSALAAAGLLVIFARTLDRVCGGSSRPPWGRVRAEPTCNRPRQARGPRPKRRAFGSTMSCGRSFLWRSTLIDVEAGGPLPLRRRRASARGDRPE